MWQFLVQFIHRLHIFIPWLFGLVSELLLPEKNIAELVQGCLLDPGFPALVAKVEDLLENGYSNDVWIILRNKENQSLLLNGWEIGHSARALLGDRISSLSLKYVDLLKIGILKKHKIVVFLDILWLTVLFLFLWLTNLQVATKCLQNNLNIFSTYSPILQQGSLYQVVCKVLWYTLVCTKYYIFCRNKEIVFIII